jgi:hypothetical protein
MNKNVNTNSIAQPNEAIQKTANRFSKGFQHLTKAWVVTLLLVAGLTLPALSAFSFQSKAQESKDRSAKKVEIRDQRAPKAPQGDDAAQTAKHQIGAQRAIQNGILGRIAAKANHTLKKLPSASPFRNANPRDRIYLEKGRKLLEAGKSATRWNATQLINYAYQLEQYEAEARANVSKTAQEKCGDAKDSCNRKCHANDDGYFCFLDCRLEYVTCLIFSGGAVQTLH